MHARCWDTVSPVVAATSVDADLALIDYADGSVSVVLDLMEPSVPTGRFPHERRDGGRDPCRGQVEEASLAKIEAGRDDAAGNALGLGVCCALDLARLSRWLRHAVSPRRGQHFIF